MIGTYATIYLHGQSRTGWFVSSAAAKTWVVETLPLLLAEYPMDSDFHVEIRFQVSSK